MNKKLEDKYIKSFQNQHKSFSDLFQYYTSQEDNWYDFNKESSEITETLLNRLKQFYKQGNNIKNLLNKNSLTPASDFFVEQVLFFVSAYLKIKNPGLIVFSERGYKLNNGKRNINLKPDISICNDKDEIVAIIECKTQLGRNRHDWNNEFIDRRNIFNNKYKNIKWFYCVMTGKNWKGHGFEETLGKDYNKLDENVKYFCLLDTETWPTNFDKLSQIDNRIEDLLLGLNNLQHVARHFRLEKFYNFFNELVQKSGFIRLETIFQQKKHYIYLDEWGRLKLKDTNEYFATPRLLFKDGIKKLVNPNVKVNHENNSISQFTYNGVQLVDEEEIWPDLLEKIRNK